MNQSNKEYCEIGTDIGKAAQILLSGRLVAIPTETVYGLAANALNEKAVASIFKVKNRPPTNPLIIHLPDAGRVEQYAMEIPSVAKRLMETFCSGPLTLILPRRDNVPDIVTAGKQTVAIRIPNHLTALELLKEVGVPLAAPSANTSGYISPTRPEHVFKTIGGKIEYILDGGHCIEGIESTIVGFEDNTPVIYRPGTISAGQIEQVAGVVKYYKGSSHLAPGMSMSHYSPITPLLLVDDINNTFEPPAHLSIGVITYNQYSKLFPQQNQLLLCQNSNFHEAAAQLYNALHEMDERNYDLIVVLKFPETDIGRALNDRLTRAAAPKV